MAHNIHLYERKTFKYVDQYRHLDREDYLATIRVTEATTTEQPRDYDDGGTYVRFARLPAGMDRERVARAIEQSESHHGCGHEYDCCGCQSRSVRVTLRGRQARIETYVTYNY